VPRFYFDVREGEHFARDTEGLEFDTVEAAEHEAARGIAEIGAYRLLKCDPREIAVDVRDEQGRRLLTVTVAMTVDRGASGLG